MSEDCIHCGSNVSAGQGQYTPDRGFLCNICHESLHIVHCSSCGQRFPSHEMKDIDGKLYCRNDAETIANTQSEPTVITEPEDTAGPEHSDDAPVRRSLDIKPLEQGYTEVKELHLHSEAPEPVKAKAEIASETTFTHNPYFGPPGPDEDTVLVEEIIHKKVKYTTVQKGKLMLSKFLLSLEQIGAEF